MSDALFLAGLLVLGALSGAAAAVVGFGIGSLLTPFLLARFEPHVAVAAVALPHLLATAVRFVQHRHAVDRGVFVRFGVPSAAGSLLGALLQMRLASPLLTATLGVLLLATGAANLTRALRILLGLPADRYRRIVGAAVAVVGAWLLVQALL